MYISNSFSNAKDVFKYIDGIDVFGSAFIYGLAAGCPTVNVYKQNREDRIDVVAQKSGMSDIGVATHMFSNVILSYEDLNKMRNFKLVPYSSIVSVAKAAVSMS